MSDSVTGIAPPFLPGPWHQSEGLIGRNPFTLVVSPNQSVEAPAPVNVELVYFDGKNWHREIYPNAFDRSITVPVNGLDPNNLSSVHFRVWGTFPGQAYDASASGGLFTGDPSWFLQNIYNPLLLLEQLADFWKMLFPNPDSLPIDPLVVDLNGDGVQLISVAQSKVNFDFDGDGFRERAGWVSAQDGLLDAETLKHYYAQHAAGGIDASATGLKEMYDINKGVGS